MGETILNRFWSRVRANRAPQPGYRALAVQEYQNAHIVFQNQWRKASKDQEKLDDAILASLPAESDELDGRLALAPRLATMPAPAYAGHHAAPMQLPTPAPHSMLAITDEQPPRKARRLTRAQRTAKHRAGQDAAPQDATTQGTANHRQAPARQDPPRGKGGKGTP